MVVTHFRQHEQGRRPWDAVVLLPRGEHSQHLRSLARIRGRSAKGRVQGIVPRIEVPHVGNIALIADPTGAFIGLFEPQMVIA